MVAFNGQSNFFFNNFKSSQEQQLIEDLVTEAISIYGIDTFYIPRKLNNYDSVYGADDQSSYEKAIPVCVYLENVMGFGGDGNFMSKFGLEIRDQIIFAMSVRVFNSEVSTITTQTRPNEGDLLYFPLNNKCFQIKYTDKFEMFFQMGGIQSYKLTCELFEYAGEKFNTGIPEIDSLQTKFSTNILDWTVDTEFGEPLLTEDSEYITLEGSSVGDKIPADDSDEIQKESDTFVDFSVKDPFSLGNISLIPFILNTSILSSLFGVLYEIWNSIPLL
jgi:hypothetical protein